MISYMIIDDNIIVCTMESGFLHMTSYFHFDTINNEIIVQTMISNV